MKKILCIFFSAVLLLMVSGCAAVSDGRDEAVLPPSRVGASQMQATLVKRYTFESAFSEADVVARVEVGNWLAENTDSITTYFEAKVLQCFKGSTTETITLFQDGCSTGTMKGYPLFTSGNEMLVFLKEAIETPYDSPLLDNGLVHYVFRCFL